MLLLVLVSCLGPIIRTPKFEIKEAGLLPFAEKFVVAGYPILDPIAALIVGLMIAKMGFEFSWTGLHDLMDKSANEDEIAAIKETLLKKDGILGLHQLRTRKMGDMIIVDVHLEVSGEQSVKEGHRIAVEARNEVLKNHNVIDVVTHIDPI
ncbi:MAG: cation diffusion facilitator family transporter [Acinetobacter sp.]